MDQEDPEIARRERRARPAAGVLAIYDPYVLVIDEYWLPEDPQAKAERRSRFLRELRRAPS